MGRPQTALTILLTPFPPPTLRLTGGGGGGLTVLVLGAWLVSCGILVKLAILRLGYC